MKKFVIFIIGVAFLILPVFSACSAEKQTGQTVKKCSTCHGLDKPKSKQKTQTEWADTVLRMKDKNGAPVNDEEAKSITEYLAKNYGK
jgi:hypothetical protein